MLDLDGSLVFMATRDPKHLASVLAVAESRDLDGAAGRALAFVAGHYAEHKSMPGLGDVRALFGEDVVNPTELAPDFLLRELRNRITWRRVQAGVIDVSEKLKANDPEAAFQAMQMAVTSVKATRREVRSAVSLFELGQVVLDEMELLKSGAIGIPTPWKSVNDMTMGLWPGTNTWLMARPGTGKTWLQVIVMEHVWRQRHAEVPRAFKQLVISGEMPKHQIAERFYTIRSKLPYGQVVSAKLGAFGEAALRQTVTEHEQESGVWILDAGDDISPSKIEDTMDELDIDLLVLDAAYRIRWNPKAKDRFENMFSGAEILSNWTKRRWGPNDKRIAALITSQMNRAGAGKGGAGKQTSAALSDNVMWEADNVFGVEQTADMKADRRMELHTVKVRRMAQHKERIALRWDMEQMEFGEIDIGSTPGFRPAAPTFRDKAWKSRVFGDEEGGF